MQTVAFLIIALIGVFLILLSQQGYFNVNPWLVIRQTSNILSQTEPIAIHIPSINTKTSVERVGIDELGKMDAPSNASVVSWYQFSATPGNKGNIVMSGHKDSTLGPGSFFTLKQINPGDEIILTRADQQQIIYTVTDINQYARETLPVDQIFANQNRTKTLYLITCDGHFDIFKRIYTKRILVTAQAS